MLQHTPLRQPAIAELRTAYRMPLAQENPEAFQTGPFCDNGDLKNYFIRQCIQEHCLVKFKIFENERGASFNGQVKKFCSNKCGKKFRNDNVETEASLSLKIYLDFAVRTGKVDVFSVSKGVFDDANSILIGLPSESTIIETIGKVIPLVIHKPVTLPTDWVEGFVEIGYLSSDNKFEVKQEELPDSFAVGLALGSGTFRNCYSVLRTTYQWRGQPDMKHYTGI
ncbi:hypothetical protein HDU79_008262, partial [Rhizoclosmatium sp. JEL0117]